MGRLEKKVEEVGVGEGETIEYEGLKIFISGSGNV